MPQSSTGIEPVERLDPELPEELEAAYEHCLPYYYELAAHAIPSVARLTARDAGRPDYDKEKILLRTRECDSPARGRTYRPRGPKRRSAGNVRWKPRSYRRCP